MSIRRSLLSTLLPRFLAEEESLRRRSLPREVVLRILAYGAPVGCVIEHHGRLDRCMDRLREMVAEAEAHHRSLAAGTVVMADELTGGTGRFDRFWHAPTGGVWLALAWADSLLPEFARLLPLAVGTACCETVRHAGINAWIKWVNDVLVDERKIAGILSRTVTGPHRGELYHLIGIGINSNNSRFPGELQRTAVSMRQVLGREVDIVAVAARLLAKLTWNIGLVHFEEERTLAAEGEETAGTSGSLVLESWRRLSDTPGRRVRYGHDVVRSPLYEAVVEAVDDSGGLLMRLDDGTLVTEYAGEVEYLE